MYIKGFHYWQPVSKCEFDNKKSICVAHCFYEDNFAEEHNIHIKDVLDFNYNYYILGHLHKPMEDTKVGDSMIYRIGSLTRGTASQDQLDRDEVFILEYDTKYDIMKRVSIPCLPAKEVFNESIFLRKEQLLDTQKVLDSLVFTSNDSIYDVLDKSEQSKEVKDIVEQYLQAAGIFRK